MVLEALPEVEAVEAALGQEVAALGQEVAASGQEVAALGPEEDVAGSSPGRLLCRMCFLRHGAGVEEIPVLKAWLWVAGLGRCFMGNTGLAQMADQLPLSSAQRFCWKVVFIVFTVLTVVFASHQFYAHRGTPIKFQFLHVARGRT